MLDDFSGGFFKKQLASGQDTNTQVGGMIGGSRLTVFSVCSIKPCGLENIFAQKASFQIRGKTKFAPSALIFSSGYYTFPRLDVQYAPLQLDLSKYDCLRVNFHGNDLIVNFNILALPNSTYSQTGCNLTASTTQSASISCLQISRAEPTSATSLDSTVFFNPAARLEPRIGRSHLLKPSRPEIRQPRSRAMDWHKGQAEILITREVGSNINARCCITGSNPPWNKAGFSNARWA